MSRVTGWFRSTLPLVAAAALMVAIGHASPALAAAESGAAAKYVEDGTASMAKGDLKAAEIQFKNALRADPDNIDARIALALVYLRQGVPSAAEGALSVVYQRGERLDQVMPLLGEAYLGQNKSEELLRTLDAKTASGELKVKVLVLRARAYLQRRQFAEAQAELNEALTLKPDAPEALLTKAELLRQARDFSGAEAIADQILAKDAKNVASLLLKGDLRRAQGDHEGARTNFDKVLAEHPENVLARLGRATVLLALKDPEGAKRDVAAVLDQDPKQPLALFLRASILAGEGDFTQAVTILQPVEKQLEGLFPAQVLLAEGNLRLKRNEQAMQYALRLYEMAPDSPISRTLLAAAHLRKNEIKKALDLLEPVAASRQGDDRLQSVLAEAYSRSGRYEAAASALGNILKNNPDNADLRARMDANLFRSGQKDEAVKDLDALIAEDPDARDANLLLFALNVQGGQVVKAAEVAERLRKAEPDNPLGHYLFGLAKQIMTDRPSAREAFQTALTKQPTFVPAVAALAQLAVTEGKPQEAREVLERLVKADPKNTQAMMSLADLSRSTGDFDNAIVWLDKAIAAAPKEVEPGIRRVDVLLQQKRSARAVAAANSVVNSFPDNVRALQALSRAQLAENQKDAAVGTLRRAASLPSTTAPDQHTLGQLLARLDRPEDARAAWLNAVKIDPLYFPAWLDLTVPDARAGRLEKALETAGRAAAADQALADTLRGHSYMAAGRAKDAEAAFAAALAKRPDSQLAALRVEARRIAGDRPGARKIQEEWLVAHPEDDRSRFTYASDLIADKDYTGSIREHELLLKKAPFNPVLLNNLAWLYSAAGDPRAEDLARRAYAASPESAEVADTLGWVLAGKGNVKEAAALLASAHAKSPNHPAIAYHLASTLAKQGDKDKALGLLKPVVGSAQPFEERAEAEALFQSLGGTR